MEPSDSTFAVSLSPTAQYSAADLVIHRTYRGEHSENLVKWSLEEDESTNTTTTVKKARDSLCKEYLVWMRREEMEACCPQLLSLEALKTVPGPSGQQAQKGRVTRSQNQTEMDIDSLEGEGSLLEMIEDIKNLVSRAKRLSSKLTSNPAGGKMLSSTINILSAYAKIGALANTFRENGALDLLLTLLSSQDGDVRRSASNMLRSLATFDPSSRAYVLLHLAKMKLTSIQGRHMLLDLFSETASSGEREVLLKGITLPQVPGRFIFSLLKKYLHVNSMTAANPLPQLESSVSQTKESSEFEKFYALDQLVSELFTIFNWFEGSLTQKGEGVLKTMKGVSIFAGTVPEEKKPAKKKKNLFRPRDDFLSEREYGRYIKTIIQPGMKVRARVSYESVSQGDYGIYRQTNDGTPPAQFTWEGLGDSYWVFWHMVELVEPDDEKEDTEEDEKEDATVASQNTPGSKQPYVMRSLSLPGGWGEQSSQRSEEKVERPFWWEILCLLKSHALEQTNVVIDILGDKKLKSFDDLINYSPSYVQVARIIEHLESVHPSLSHDPLTIKDKSQFRDVYNDQVASIPPAKGGVSLDEEYVGDLKRDPPFTDPLSKEDPLSLFSESSFDIDEEAMFDDFSLAVLKRLSRDRDAPGPDFLLRLRLLEHRQDGSVDSFNSVKVLFEKMLEKEEPSVHLAFQAIRILRNGCQKIHRERDRSELCVSGLLSFILRVMRVCPKSFALQCGGIEVMFDIMGGYGLDRSFMKLSNDENKAELLSESTRSVILTSLCSIASAPGDDLKVLVDGLECVAEYFHTRLSTAQQSLAATSVQRGLLILSLLLKDKDVIAKFTEWGVSNVLKAIKRCLPAFLGKKDLIARIGSCVPGFSLETVTENVDETPEAVSKMNQDILAVLKTLRKLDELEKNNPLPLIISLMDRDILSTEKFVPLTPLFVSVFLKHHGVFYLCQALEHNKDPQFVRDTITIFGSLAKFSEEAAAEVVLQGGLRGIIFIMNTHSFSDIMLVCLQILSIMSKDPDHLVVMAAENIMTPLKNVKERFPIKLDICNTASELAELCETEETSRAGLHQNILRIIFSGVLQLFLDAIEEARRDRELLYLPKFSAFIRYLSAGSGGAVSALQEHWWEALEVSTNSQHKENLLDGSDSTYWESSGRAGTHWIRLHMKKGLIIKKMYLEISSESTFIPQKVTVSGGSTADNAQEISSVHIPSTFNGSYEVVSNAKKYHAVIIIRIKRCQLAGVDCRIHGITCQATTTSLWPLFGDIFSARSKLFYRIQLQTWLKNSSHGPLELFDKLSSVILYEQIFGDSFLHTVQARQCIGQACRSALMTPLIESIALPSSVGPDLSELLHDYISLMQSPQISQWRALAACVSGGGSMEQGSGGRVSDMEVLSSQESTMEQADFDKAQKRLVKMSQIRRLCRLLVDCDDNSHKKPTKTEPEFTIPKYESTTGLVNVPGRINLGNGLSYQNPNYVPEDDPPEEPEPSTNSGLGTMALAKCWGGIVESEVSAVLKKFNLDSPYQVASELINIYDRLKQAMIELFGGHSQFALSLKEGFSRAFQSLDEVTGVRFCELLCLCVNSLMDTAGKDASKLLNLGECQREMMLFHFAEPLQFLHNLDLAHIFEHYYKCHLSARLLRGRSISLLLEQRLAQTFSHCFPHKYPLQMLSDLEESQGLMDRFCDSELLESLDQLILQASGQNSLPPEIVRLSQKCSLYRQRVFQVYSLNPCFWPVRPRPLPVSHLPAPLDQFCEDYIKFFTSVHECGLQQHERPRRLHFTLHGWAHLTYGGIKLIVSTVQMCILLQFRTTDSHSLHSLQEATQLPYQDICEALLSLTADRQCILTTATQSEATPTSTATPTLDEELVLSLQNTPFKVSTMFKVNGEFTKDMFTKQKLSKVRFHDVRLVPRGHPSREDHAVDLAHVFERRRAVMDSAIVRILKKDKQMSMDNIAHKVIKGCSAGRFDRGALFGRFDCDYRDVCSRVDRLIVNGYIKRDKTNKQMLVYEPDPSASQQDDTTPEQTENVAKEPKSKEVKTKPGSSSSKMTEVASPLSPATGASGTTSKLQLPRKRSGMGRQPQSKTKRKPTPFTRIYSNESYEQHDAPLLGMLPTARSLGPDEVQSQIDSLMESISQVLEIDHQHLEYLLHHFQWNKDTFIQRYLNDSSVVLEEAGLSGKAGKSPPTRRRMVSCPVCLLSVTYKELAWLWCNHACCKSCWQNHLLTQTDLNRALDCSCPVFGCPARPTRTFFVKLFGTDTDPLNKFSKAIVQSYVERSGWLTWCRNPQGCTQVLCCGDGMDSGGCHKCGWSSCFSCTFIESHQPASCEDMQKWVDSGGFYVGMDEDAKSKQLANTIAKKCPGCRAQIEKNEGCLHMKCKCGHDFCWNCLKPWNPTHTDYFNCSAKVSKAARDHKKFQDYTDLCASHHRSKLFSEKLCLVVKGISASVPIKTLSFVSDACDLLVQCHKMLLYTTVADYFCKADNSGYLGFLSENLEGDTNILQAFLENTLMSSSTDVSKAISVLPDKKLQDLYCLVSKIENTRDKLLVGSQQQFKLGEITDLSHSSDNEEDEDRDAADVCDYDDFDEEDFDDEDDFDVYSDYEDSFHDAFDSWDEGYDYDDIFPFY